MAIVRARVPALTATFFFKGERFRKGTPLANLPAEVIESLPKRYAKEGAGLPPELPKNAKVLDQTNAKEVAPDAAAATANAELLARRQALADAAAAEAAASAEAAGPTRTRRSN